MVDADSLLDPDSLLHVSRPFADDPDRVVAAGGVVRVAERLDILRGRVTHYGCPHRGWPGSRSSSTSVRSWSAAPAGPRPGAADHLRRLRRLPRGRRCRESAGWRPTASARTPSWSSACTAGWGTPVRRSGRLRRRAGRLDRGARGPAVAPQAATPLAPRAHRDPQPAPRHAVRPRYGVIGMLTMPWFVVFELLAPFVEVFGVASSWSCSCAGPREHRLAALDLVDSWACGAARRLALLLLPAHPGRPAGRGVVLRRYREWATAARGVGHGRGELRLPAAERLVAGRRHRGAAEGPARLGRHAAQGLRSKP